MTASKNALQRDSNRVTASLAGITGLALSCLIAAAMTGCGGKSDGSSNGNTSVSTSDMTSMLTLFGPDMDGVYLIISQAEDENNEATARNSDATIASLTLNPVEDREAK